MPGDSVLTADPGDFSSAARSHDRPHAGSSSSKENLPLPPNGQNGHHGHHGHYEDAEGESEAETVVLSHDDDAAAARKPIKVERMDDDTVRLRAFKEQPRPHSPQYNGHSGRRRASNGKIVKLNGAKHERAAKSPVPTSPSSHTTSRHTKDTSPTDSAKSPAPPSVSPTQTLARGRSASTLESRKRKVRDGSLPKSIEPPRQKVRTEGLKEHRQPHSPATPGFGRPHKRSQSTQSAVATGATGRKRRDVKDLTIEPTRWSESSSDRSASPQPAVAPHFQHSRVKRSSHRAVTSPARTIPMRKLDKFGATRLAKEAEKGDVDAVREAFEDAPDELDMVDYAGISPLQKAALNGNAAVIIFLINKGCRTDCESNDRDTPLIDAVENSHLEAVRLLLNLGHVNPHHHNKKGQRAVDVLDYEHEDAEKIEKELREAMKREVDTSHNDKPGRKQAKTASRLLYNEFNVETLIEKAGDGDISAVGELINSNIKPNITCGVAAARGGHYDILSILLASGLKADPDPSKHPETPMTVAIGRGHTKIIELLLEQDNFDPTRRNKEHKTYWEISEERRGPKWEQERDILYRAFGEHKGAHRSPRRLKKEPPSATNLRMKKKCSPQRERSSSPRPETKRSHLPKPVATSAAPQKSRRLLSGKEKATREVQRRKPVVDEESSEEESEDDVRPPTRKVKPRSYSEGDDAEPVRKPLKARSDDNETKRPVRQHQDHSDEDHGTLNPIKPRAKLVKSHSAKPTSEIDSPDERKPPKNKIKYKKMDDKIRRRKLSDVSMDDAGMKKTPTASAKSTPAPPDRTATPDMERAKRLEEVRLHAEAKRKAAEAAAEAEERRKEAEEAARKAAEEEEARMKAEAEAEAKRQAEEAKAERKRQEEEEAKRLAEEEAERQWQLAARQDRVSKLPKALRRACELGTNRPLHFKYREEGVEMGVSAVFLPLMYATAQKMQDPQALPDKNYICSFQLVGILGLPELDLAHLASPYCDWPRMSVTSQQRDILLRHYDVAMLAQDYQFPPEGSPEYNFNIIAERVREARRQFLAMEPLYWIEESLLYAEMDKIDSLRPLLAQCKSQRFYLSDLDVDYKLKKKHNPRKGFANFVLKQNSDISGAGNATMNGKG